MRTVALFETHPLMAEGVRAVLSGCEDFHYVGAVTSLAAATDLLRDNSADILIVGTEAAQKWLPEARTNRLAGAIVIWADSIREADALRWLNAGARGILFRTTTAERLVTCLRSVAEGRRWVEEGIFKDATRPVRRYPRSELTEREHQVRELVAQGFKNREIADRLGIKDATVKIHLQHIFEKTGVNGRYALALEGWNGHTSSLGGTPQNSD